MSAMGLLLTLAIIGCALWLVNAIVPMDPKIKTIMNVVVVVLVLFWVGQAFGIVPACSTMRLDRPMR